MAQIVVGNAPTQFINLLIYERSLDEYYKYNLKPEMFGSYEGLMRKIIKFTEEYGETPVLETVFEWDRDFYDCLEIQDPEILARQMQVDYFYRTKFNKKLNECIDNVQIGPEEAMRDMAEFCMENMEIIYGKGSWETSFLGQSEEELEPPSIIPNLLSHGGLSFISGYEGLGKSILTARLMYAIGEGEYPFDNCDENTKLWKKAVKQKVLYVSLEGNLASKCKTYGIDSSNVICISPDPVEEDFNLLNPSTWNRLIALCIKYGAKVIVIDPLYLAISNKNMLDADMANILIKRANRLYKDKRISTIIVHHNTLSVDGDKTKSPKQAGSSYFKWGACDIWNLLKTPKELDEEIGDEQAEYLNAGKIPPQYVMMRREKIRYGLRFFDNLLVKFDRENGTITCRIYIPEKTSIKNSSGRRNTGNGSEDMIKREALKILEDLRRENTFKISKKRFAEKILEILEILGTRIDYRTYKSHYASNLYNSLVELKKITMDKNNIYLVTEDVF